jgi:hypothetical protein
MIRVLFKLMLLSLLATAGVHLSYEQIEKKIIEPPWFPQVDFTQSQGKEHIDGLDKLVAGIDENTLRQVGKDTRIILQRNLFQTGAAPQPVAPPPTPKPVVETAAVPIPTSLNLSLVGTMISNQTRSRAIMVDNQKRGEQQLLQVGDGIQGAIVQAIEWNRVILDVNGKQEILEMPKPQDNASATPASRVQASRLAPALPPPSAPILPEAEDHQQARQRRPPAPPLRPQRRIDLPLPESNIIDESTEILLPPME